MIWQVSRVLALSAHTDDAEFGAGGFISKLIAEGIEVHSAVFSIARDSVPEGFAEDVLAHEVREAAKRLGISDERLYVMDYPVRWLPKYRQEILEELVRLRKQVNPDLVLVHASADVHQDHHTLYEEAVRAFKRVTILGYQVPWNVIEGDSRLVIGLREEYFNNKIAALDAYKSQQRRAYADPEFIRAWARTCGIAIETPYAETYEVIRWVIQP